jgi:chorismate mutase
VPRDETFDAVVRQMRDAIIDNDLKLMQSMNRRLELVARLRAFKEQAGVAFVDPSREEWMHRYLQGANRGPLSAQGLRELYEHVLELTKRETARRAAAEEAPRPTA